VFCAVFFSAFIAAQVAVTPLEPSTTLVRTLNGGETHAYQIALLAGQFLYVVVDQRGIDVGVTATDGNARQIAFSDNPNGAFGPEPLAFIADQSGTYRIEIRSRRDSASAASYEIRVVALRSATADDRNHVAALQAFAEGQRLRTQNTAESRLRAIEQYQKSLAFFRSTGDRFNEVLTAYRIAFVYANSSDFRKTLEYLNAVVPFAASIDDANMSATVLNLMGGAYDALGDLENALKFYEDALVEFRKVGNRSSEAAVLNNIGKIYEDTAEWQKALDFNSRAVEVARNAGDQRLEAIALRNLGLTHEALGENQKSLDYYQRALPLRRVVGDKAGEAETLKSISSAYAHIGQVDKALEYNEQALDLRKTVGDSRGQALTLTSLAETYVAAGDLKKAEETYQTALPLARMVGDRRLLSILLNGLADLHTREKKIETAIENYSEALTIAQSLGDRQNVSKALQGLARANRDLGNLTEAREFISKGVAELEDVRSGVVSQDLRASYVAARQEAYLLFVDILMRLHQRFPSDGYDALALETSERARARSLLEMLVEARVDIRRGVDPQLVSREKQLSQLLQTKSERMLQLPGGSAGQEQADAFNKEIAQLENEYQQVQAEIRKNSPEFAAITQPQPLNAAAIQALLDDDTLLLEYSLAPERSYAWAVTPRSLQTYELPGRDEIEKSAREVYELVTARSTAKKGESARQKQERIARADAQLPAAIQRLSRLVTKPLQGNPKQKRIVVVADGALQYVPIAMLTLSAPGAAYRPLVLDYEIVNVPSASVLAIQRQTAAQRKPAPKGVAVFADPVFSIRDARVKSAKNKPAEEYVGDVAVATRLLEHLGDDSGTSGGTRIIPRLPFTASEAKAIESAAAGFSNLSALDFKASRSTVLNSNLSDYRYIHFATHGYLDSERPDLSALVLSLVDENGNPREGFLRAHEIYNLNLPAELVVLSACETGLGKDIRGEGLVGLTRGFMYAGASRVAVSLWSVSDKATSELMHDFYQAMLKRGESPAAALRAAQVQLLKQKAWSSPYYWAPFVLQGEWK
jgi:CHAT domain-containing protein/tetratricopeptide (TPR) repeat protein